MSTAGVPVPPVIPRTLADKPPVAPVIHGTLADKPPVPPVIHGTLADKPPVAPWHPSWPQIVKKFRPGRFAFPSFLWYTFPKE